MKKRYTMAFTILILLCFILAILSICIGSVRIPLKEIWGSFFGAEKDELYRNILYQLRLPRLLAAMILGGALSLSGYLLQTYFHNPIAGPFILGISSGAKLVVAAAMLLFLGSASAMSSWTMIIAAFIGALISMSFVLLMARLVKHMSILLISGVMIGYICSAITDLIVTFADDADIVNLHNWSKGSFSGITWDNVLVMTIVVAASFLGVFLISKPMSAYQLGEDYAASVGVNVKAFRALIVILSSLLAACVTAFAGPVSFVGIAVPHLVKQLLRSSRPILMIPACFLGGGAFCMFCDLLARTLLAPTELSISTMTAIFGAPVVIVILLRRKTR